jgi:nitroreductase
MMDTLTCIRTRRTTREFLPRDVPEPTIRRILEAGRLSPSARNQQPWHFVVIQDKGVLQQLATLCTSGRFIEQASCAVAVVTDPSNRWHEIDGARAVQSMERERIKDLLGIPAHLHLLTILPFGYPVAADAPRRRTKKRPEDIFHWGRFGQRR